MNALKRRIVDLEDGRYWALYGQRGVISWSLCKERGETWNGPVTIHSPRQLLDDTKPTDDCPFLEGACYLDAGYLAGDRIGQIWTNNDRDDEVIWDELADWYTGYLAGGAS